MYFLVEFIFCINFLIGSILCGQTDRYQHNSVIINNQLLIFAGWNDQNQNQLTSLFYLDLLKPFDNVNIPWTSIPNGDLPVYAWASTAIVGLNNSTIFQIGGYEKNKNTLNYNYSNQVYTYDYPTSKWTIPSIIGDSIPPRQLINGVIDNSGIIYIFGGFNATNLTVFTGQMYNDMNILNTSSMTWKTLSPSLPPSECCSYSANILSNGIIVYIGGILLGGGSYASAPLDEVKRDTSPILEIYTNSNTYLLKMNDIKLFDTKKLEWSSMNATGGDVVDPRWQFSSVLTPDGNIIIFGGCTIDFTSVSPKLAVLDTNKSPYKWTIPIDSEFNSPPSIHGHSANLYFNYMIITFGNNTNDKTYNSQVYLYNITNNRWITNFIPPINTTTSTSPTSICTGTGTCTNTNAISPSASTSANNTLPTKALAIGFGIGISVVIMIFAVIFIFRKKVKSQVLEIAGSNENPNHDS
ncbi:hypothetical protein Glove_459g12 [Diversispora epigaea]|uniref:Galactose oxidase n=1 Tax=Diversispora epigaea TaxID=1348612 RepID=A0A397GNN9_9GLOM|nr:hypothetical protein Glove_459g12 [Diversispora epigaea]